MLKRYLIKKFKYKGQPKRCLWYWKHYRCMCNACIESQEKTISYECKRCFCRVDI